MEDCRGGRGWIWGLCDGAADDEVGGPEAESFSGGGDALLVSHGASGGADAGSDENARRAGESAEIGDLFSGADKAVDAGGAAEAGEEFDLGSGFACSADGGELCSIHAGENGDCEQLRRGRERGERFLCRGHHHWPAECVQGEEFNAEGCGGTDGAGDGVGNVMEFEVEEDGVAAPSNPIEDGWPSGDEEFQSDLEPADGAVELVDELERGGGVGIVKRDNQAVTGGEVVDRGWHRRG